MSSHFNANQYDDAFHSKRLQNWQIPKTFKEHPSQYDGFTQIIANDRGHILPGVSRSQVSPWGEFLGTWDMPRKIPGNATKTMEQSKYLCTVQQTQQKTKTISPGKTEGAAASPCHNDTPMEHRPENPSPNKAGSPPPKTTTPPQNKHIMKDAC
ncbi:protein Flattop homolog [Antedon mediterranea]|uniref:protein Flattop homolog n=1 Tax=Antedon mediterranea TaxID=105859 RepID=UPI003AF7D666